MKRVISFCLYKAPSDWERVMETTHNKYISGLYQNINLIQKYYPNWHIYLYHNELFDISKIQKNIDYDKLEFKLITNPLISAMQWRFLPNDDEDVELFIVRDIDSRITEREKVSVDEWVESKKILHIMRDHPHHEYHILGGMWGMRRQPNFNMESSCIEYNTSKNYRVDVDWYEKWWDMHFLRDIIYPNYVDSSYVNSSFHAMEPWSKPFSLERDDNKFVGEIYLDTDKRDYHYTLL